MFITSLKRLLLIVLLAPVAFGQFVSLDVQTKGSRLPSWSTDSGTANAYVLTTVAPLAPSLRTGSCFQFVAANASTGASTIAVDGGGAITVKRADGSTAVGSNDIDGLSVVCYDGTIFRLYPMGSASGGGDTITVNGSALASSTGNFNNTTPAASSNFVNVQWQKDALSPTNISAQVPAATNSVLGVVETIACSSHNWISSIASGTGVPSCTQPAFTDLSGSLGCGQMPTLTGDVINTSCATTVQALHLSPAPADCSTGSYATGIDANGNATGCTTVSGGGTGSANTPYATPVAASSTIPYYGLAIWFSADCITVTNASTCSSPSNGTSIDTWDDRSGNAIVAWSTNPCTFATSQINSQPAVSFNGSCGSYNLIAIGAATQWRNHITIFAVAKAAVTGSNLGIIGGNNDVYYRIPGAAQSKEQQISDQNIADLGNGTHAVDTNWHQMNVTCTISTLISASVQPIFRIDRSSDATLNGANCNRWNSNSNSVAIQTLGWGGSNVNELFNGSIAEVIVYNRVLSSTEITDVESYLHAKYGL